MAASAGAALPVSNEDHRNEVIIAGRLSAPALAKELPSGDEIVVWRLVVDRATSEGARKVDVVDCTAFGARVRRQALGWNEGEVIEVTGALRRRFWRSPGGLQSRCEVEVDSATRHRGRAAGGRAAGRQVAGSRAAGGRSSSPGDRQAAVAAVKRPRKPG